jgi:hypothetical protein
VDGVNLYEGSHRGCGVGGGGSGGEVGVAFGVPVCDYLFDGVVEVAAPIAGVLFVYATAACQQSPFLQLKVKYSYV